MRLITTIMFALMILAAFASPERAIGADAAPLDAVISLDGATVRGRITRITADGRLTMRNADDSGASEMNLLRVKRIVLNPGRELQRDYFTGAVAFHLADGSRITGSIKEWRDDAVEVVNDYCSATIPRRAITSASIDVNRAVMLPRSEGADDIIVVREKPDVRQKCKILSFSDSEVKFKIGDTTHTAPLNQVVGVAPGGSDMPPRKRDADGWYAAVRMANGDRLSGLVQKMDGAALTLLTRYAGAVALKREAVDRLDFSASSAFSYGGLLVSDPVGGRVAMFNDEGRILWESPGASCGSDATALSNGQVLTVSDFADTVKRLAANGRAINALDAGLKRLTSIALLDNGDCLVAEGRGGALYRITPNGKIVAKFFENQVRADPYIRTMVDGKVLLVDGKNRVSKWSLEENRMIWSFTVEDVRGAADLGGGRIAVLTKNALLVVDEYGKEKWRLKADIPDFRRVGVCITHDGNILFPVTRQWVSEERRGKTTVILTYSPDGEKMREVPLEGEGFPVASLEQE
jgi:hypothetical protein